MHGIKLFLLKSSAAVISSFLIYLMSSFLTSLQPNINYYYQIKCHSFDIQLYYCFFFVV